MIHISYRKIHNFRLTEEGIKDIRMIVLSPSVVFHMFTGTLHALFKFTACIWVISYSDWKTHIKIH